MRGVTKHMFKRFKRSTLDDEHGGAIVELCFVIPIVLIIIAGVLDLSIQMSTWSSTESAATAAARTLISNPSASDADIRSAVLSDAPQLEDADFVIVVDKESVQNSSYTHHFAHSDGTVDDRLSTQTTQEVIVTVNTKTDYLTAIGSLFSQATGHSDGKCYATSSSVATIDLTKGSTW